MLDLSLLKTLLCVAEERNFTRAAERVHRTQSTVSQQIRKLEDAVGHTLLLRDRSGSNVAVTERGEVLAGYARKLLRLAQEAEDALSTPQASTPVRLGIPEDFNVEWMSKILSGFLNANPLVRMETASGMSTYLRARLAAGELDLAVVKREPTAGLCIAQWTEPIVWVGGKDVAKVSDVVSLALFPQGCVYRKHAIHALEKAGRRWRVAFESHSLTGVQAAVASGLAVSVLPKTAVLPVHRTLGPAEGFDELPCTELALISNAMPLTATQQALVEFLDKQISKLFRKPAATHEIKKVRGRSKRKAGQKA